MRFLAEKFRASTTPLQRIVSHAYQRNPFYRAKIDAAGGEPHKVHTVEDLCRHLPMTTREELASDPWVLLAVAKESLVQAHMSTGTTGANSLYVSYDWEDLYVRGLQPLFAEAPNAQMLRIQPGEVVFNALPYEVSVTGLAIHRAVQDGIGACVVPVGKGGFYSDPAKTLKLMKEIQGDHLFTTPSYAIHLAEVAQAAVGIPASRMNLRSIWLVGELCSDALRRRVEAAWGCPAFLYWGSLECGPIGLECSEQEGCHVATGFVAVELVETEQDLRTLAGQRLGEVVVTPLWRYATPVLRYRTGDLAYREQQPCACGHPGGRLRVHGRREDMFAIGGRTFHCMDVEQGLLSIDGVTPWFRLKVDKAVLRVLLPGSEEDARAVKPLIREWIARALGLDSGVEAVPVAEYAGGKFQRLVRE